MRFFPRLDIKPTYREPDTKEREGKKKRRKYVLYELLRCNSSMFSSNTSCSHYFFFFFFGCVPETIRSYIYIYFQALSFSFPAIIIFCMMGSTCSSPRYRRGGFAAFVLLCFSGILSVLFLLCCSAAAATVNTNTEAAKWSMSERLKEIGLTTTNQKIPLLGYVDMENMERGFPYEYFFENGITHLVVQGLHLNCNTMKIERDGLPKDDEWARLHAVAQKYGAKLLLGIGGGDEASDLLEHCINLYFFAQDHYDEDRRSRLALYEGLAEMLVDRDFDGVDIDYRPRHREMSEHMYWGARNIGRDLRELVEKIREIRQTDGERKKKKAVRKYDRFLVSVSLFSSGGSLVVVEKGELEKHVDILHWRLYHHGVDNHFYLQKGHSVPSGPLDAMRKRKDHQRGVGPATEHEVGHGDQHGQFYHHSSVNSTVAQLRNIAEGRLVAHKGGDLITWSRDKRVYMEDVVEDGVVHPLDPQGLQKVSAEALKNLFTNNICLKEDEKSDLQQGSRILHVFSIPCFGGDTLHHTLPYSSIISQVREIAGDGDISHVYILEGVGFDNVLSVKEKLRLGMQLGFAGAALVHLEHDVLPTGYTPVNIPPLHKGMDLSGPRKPASTLPPVPALPRDSLLGAVKEELDAWEEPSKRDYACTLHPSDVEEYLFLPGVYMPQLHRSNPIPLPPHSYVQEKLDRHHEDADRVEKEGFQHTIEDDL